MARRPTRTALTKLEAEIMGVVWDAEPDPVRVRDVVDALNAGRRPRLAYNTVQTMLTILKDKGIVRVVGGEGRAHLFGARVSRVEASRHMVGDLVDRLFGGRVQPLLHQLIEDPDLDAGDLEQLRDWVDERLRDGDGGAS